MGDQFCRSYAINRLSSATTKGELKKYTYEFRKPKLDFSEAKIRNYPIDLWKKIFNIIYKYIYLSSCCSSNILGCPTIEQTLEWVNGDSFLE